METPNFYFCLNDNLQELCNLNSDLKITPELFLPTRGRPKDTGFDVRCAVYPGVTLTPGGYFKIPLGFKMFAPDGWGLDLRARSGTFVNLNIVSHLGTIDQTFESEMLFAGRYDPDARKLLGAAEPKIISFGERIAQLIPVKVQNMTRTICSTEEYKKLCEKRNDERGEGGFGSSGRF